MSEARGFPLEAAKMQTFPNFYPKAHIFTISSQKPKYEQSDFETLAFELDCRHFLLGSSNISHLTVRTPVIWLHPYNKAGHRHSRADLVDLG